MASAGSFNRQLTVTRGNSASGLFFKSPWYTYTPQHTTTARTRKRKEERPPRQQPTYSRSAPHRIVRIRGNVTVRAVAQETPYNGTASGCVVGSGDTSFSDFTRLSDRRPIQFTSGGDSRAAPGRILLINGLDTKRRAGQRGFPRAEFRDTWKGNPTSSCSASSILTSRRITPAGPPRQKNRQPE